GDALAMLAAADAGRPAGHSGQFGRFTGIDYSDRPSVRAIQTAAPLLSGRTGYAIPPGPYRDGARGPVVPAGQNPFGPPPGGAQPYVPSRPPPSGPSQSGPPQSGPAQPGPVSSGPTPSATPASLPPEGPGCPTGHHPLLKPALSAYGDPVMPDPSALTPPVRRKPLLAVLLAPLFMALIAVSVINVGLTAIGEGLEADTGSLQWVISGYALAFGMLLVPAGRAGDATGRRRMFVIGVGIFTLGSLLSGFAPNVEVLNLARVLQGLGSGLLNPQTVALIQHHFRGHDRARAFALLATTVAVATAIGPVVGGALIQVLGPEWGWRWMFLMNAPIGVIAIIGAFR